MLIITGAFELPIGRRSVQLRTIACMERHLNLNVRMVATLPLYGLTLKWGVSVVFIYSQCVTLHAPRSRYAARVQHGRLQSVQKMKPLYMPIFMIVDALIFGFREFNRKRRRSIS